MDLDGVDGQITQSKDFYCWRAAEDSPTAIALLAVAAVGRYSDRVLCHSTPRVCRLLLAILAGIVVGGPPAIAEGQRAFFTVDEAVRADPAATGAVVRRVKAGTIAMVGERRGFWRRIESFPGAAGTAGDAPAGGRDAPVGWVRLSALRLPNAKPAPGLAAFGTGRDATGNVVLSSGARTFARPPGSAARLTALTAEALRAAPANDRAIDGLTILEISPALRTRFQTEGALVNRTFTSPPPVAASRCPPTVDGRAPAAVEREIAAKIFGLVPPVSVPGLQSYLALVGDGLVTAAARDRAGTPPQNWRFVLLDTPTLATFALPDGLVLVSRGLFGELATEDELAAVLAREIAHIRACHHWRTLRSPALETYLEPLAVELEFSADARGMWLAAAAGYDASALLSVLERIDAATAAGRDSRLLSSVLPTVSDRLATLAAAATPELERASVLSTAAPRLAVFGGGGPPVKGAR